MTLADVIGIDNPMWHDRAACRTVDPAIFFKRVSNNQRVAKNICRNCPVLQKCHDWILALEESEREVSGIYAGLTANERMRIRRKRRLANAQQAEEYTEAAQAQDL